MKKEKLCMFCQNIIDLERDKHVLMGTYDGEKVMDESYYHFECFNQWYNSRVKQKAENVIKGATKKVTGMLGGLRNMIPQMQQGFSSGEQVVDIEQELPNMEKEIPKMDFNKYDDMFNQNKKEGKKKCKKKK